MKVAQMVAEKTVLKQQIHEARANLNTPSQDTVCKSHKFLAHGIDTLLLIKEVELDEAEQFRKELRAEAIKASVKAVWQIGAVIITLVGVGLLVIIKM
jgi:hypothetical protein